MNNPSVNISTEVSSDALFCIKKYAICPGYRAHTRRQVQTLLPLHGQGGRAGRDAVSGEKIFWFTDRWRCLEIEKKCFPSLDIQITPLHLVFQVRKNVRLNFSTLSGSKVVMY